MEVEVIIIPDVHGRVFWQEALDYINSGVPTIFLGDYLDPYRYEGITGEDAIRNFEEILEVTKNEKTNITLLTGNHDCTYLFPLEKICEDRVDYYRYGEIQKLFRENKDLFYLAVKSGNILYSHAGIHKEWLDWVSVKEEAIIGRPVINLSQRIIDGLYIRSIYREGEFEFGSPVWADIREWSSSSLWEETQIVGHTQLQGEPLRTRSVVCLDTRECFYVDKEGDIRRLRDDRVI